MDAKDSDSEATDDVDEDDGISETWMQDVENELEEGELRPDGTPEIQPEKTESRDTCVKSPSNFGNIKAGGNEGTKNNSQHNEVRMADTNDWSNEIDMKFGIPIRREIGDTNGDLMGTKTDGMVNMEVGPSLNGTRPNNKIFTRLPHSIPTTGQNIFSAQFDDTQSGTEHSNNEAKIKKKKKRARVGSRSSPRSSISSSSYNSSSKGGDIPLAPRSNASLDLNRNPSNSLPNSNYRDGLDES